MHRNTDIDRVALILEGQIGDSDNPTATSQTSYDAVLNAFGMVYPESKEMIAYDRSRRLELLGLTNEFVSAETAVSVGTDNGATKVEGKRT